MLHTDHPDIEPRCLEPKIELPGCKASYDMFYYNSAKKVCQYYMSNGCPQTSNKFLTPDNCMMACKTDKSNYEVEVELKEEKKEQDVDRGETEG